MKFEFNIVGIWENGALRGKDPWCLWKTLDGSEKYTGWGERKGWGKEGRQMWQNANHWWRRMKSIWGFFVPLFQLFCKFVFISKFRSLKHERGEAFFYRKQLINVKRVRKPQWNKRLGQQSPTIRCKRKMYLFNEQIWWTPHKSSKLSTVNNEAN